MKSWVHYLVILCLYCVEAHPWLHLLLPRFRILDLPVNFAANDWKVHLNKSIETVPNSLLVFVEVWDSFNYIPLRRNKICKNGLAGLLLLLYFFIFLLFFGCSFHFALIMLTFFHAFSFKWSFI